MQLEIERKFLIEYPDIKALDDYPGSYKFHIKQIYLSDGSRIRQRTRDDETEYFLTVKHYISDITSVENEKVVSECEFEKLLTEADKSKNMIEKIRYVLPSGSHKAEIDLYPFWHDRAILEIELESEEDTFILPDFIKVIREVTSDIRYKNKSIAENIPQDNL